MVAVTGNARRVLVCLSACRVQSSKVIFVVLSVSVMSMSVVCLVLSLVVFFP